MFCPECKAEYRQGFTRCADCDVELVYALPQDSEQQAADERGGEFAGEDRDRKLIWKGNDESECVALCRLLMKADIPYKVAQVPVAAQFKMRVKWRYEIGVLYADSQLAKDLLGIEGEFADACYDLDDDDETEGGNDADELRADDTPPDVLVIDAARLVPKRRRDIGRDWVRQRVVSLVMVSRFVPGLRLPTYTTLGFLHAPLGRFALAAIGATLLWTSGLFYISLRLGTLMMHYLGVWRWAGLAIFLIVLVMVGRLATRIYDKRTSS